MFEIVQFFDTLFVLLCSPGSVAPAFNVQPHWCGFQDEFGPRLTGAPHRCWWHPMQSSASSLDYSSHLGLQGILGFFCFVYVLWIHSETNDSQGRIPPLAMREDCSSLPPEGCPMGVILACLPPLLCHLWPFLSNTNTTCNCMRDFFQLSPCAELYTGLSSTVCAAELNCSYSWLKRRLIPGKTPERAPSAAPKANLCWCSSAAWNLNSYIHVRNQNPLQ